MFCNHILKEKISSLTKAGRKPSIWLITGYLQQNNEHWHFMINIHQTFTDRKTKTLVITLKDIDTQEKLVTVIKNANIDVLKQHVLGYLTRILFMKCYVR